MARAEPSDDDDPSPDAPRRRRARTHSRPTDRTRRRTGRARSLARELPLAILGLTVLIGPQLLGGVYGWGTSILAGLAGATALATAWRARADGAAVPLGTGATVLGLALAWTAVQALPLPRALVALLQPRAVEVADATARLLETDLPSFVSLSLSPAGTRFELVEAGALLAVYCAALVLAARRRTWVLRLAALSTLLMALVALAHLAAAADQVFGLYQQVHTGSYLLAPLVNHNHLGGFLAMGVPILIGLGLDEDETGRRALWLGGAVVVGATALLTTSRGAGASLLIGLMGFGLLVLLRRRARGRATAPALALAGATGVVAVGLGLYVGAGTVLQRMFEDRDYSKLDLAAQGLGLALDHPFVGVGRGAFSAAFVAEHGSITRFTHPENLLAQWTSEWGLVFAVGALFALGALVLRGVGRARSFAHLGAAAAILSIVAHDMVDFALELSGVAMVAVTILAALVAPSDRERGADERRAGRTWMGTGAAGLAALALLVAFGWRLDGESVYGMQESLSTQLREGERTAFADTLEEALRLHPAEPTFPLLAGAEAVAHDDIRGLAWLNRTMNLAERWATPHVLAGELLARRGRVEQALLEAWEADARQPGTGANLVVRLLGARPPLLDEVVRLAPEDAAGMAFLERIAAALPGDSPLTPALDATLLERDSEPARLRAAQRALAARDGAAALAVLAPLASRRDSGVQLARARAYLLMGRPIAAGRVLDRLDQWSAPSDAALNLHAEVQVAAGDHDGMRATMERIRGRAAGQAPRVAAVWIQQGDLERGLENDGRAMQAYERAARIDPDSPALARVAALAAELGQLGRAYRAHSDLCRLEGEDSAHCASAQAVRARMTERPGDPLQPDQAPAP